MNKFLLVAFFLLQAQTWGEEPLCPHVVLKEGKIKLNKNEKILVCGSEDSSGWQSIPLPQAEYELKVILENRGYLNSRFDRQEDTLFVWTGPVKVTKNLVVNGRSDLVHPEKKRKIIGHPLEPAKLDEVSAWADLILRRAGYACPTIKITANAWEGTIQADIDSGDIKTIGAVERSGMESLDAQAVSARFDAFRSGEVYDVIDTQITTSRMLAQGLFQSAYFTNRCQGEQVDLHLFVDTGKPHLFRFDLGASTEELPFGDLWFKNTHLDPRASNFTINLHASPILQSLNASSELYHVPWSAQVYVGPRFEVSRQRETAYDLFKSTVGFDLGRQWDAFKTRFESKGGPTFNYEKTLRGIGPQNIKYLSLQASLNIMSHPYEAFLRDQFEGWNASLKYQGQHRGLGSSLNVDRYDLDFKYLWNIAGFSPPLLILATRVNAGVVDTHGLRLNQFTELPIDYRIFYGGDQNLRGFGRGSLNNGGLGYLTALQLGFELRLIEQIPFHIEPFLLWDNAQLGQNSFTLDEAIYSSYGFGLRWASPFGTLRGSVARGKILRGNQSTAAYTQGWIYFVSFGQEF